MFCKNCGAQLPDNAKFCTSCGSKIEVEQPEQQQQDYYDGHQDNHNDDYYDDEPKKDTTFNYNQGLQEGTTYSDRPTNVYGKKFSVGTSGSVSFGNQNKKPGFFKKLIVGGFIFVVIIVAYFALFGDSGPIYDIEIGAEIDSETYYPSEPLDYVIASDGVLYISYSTRDLDVGEYFTVEVYDVTFDETFITSVYVSVDFEEQIGYVPVDHNWTVGDYEIRFMMYGEEVATHSFEVTFD